MKIMFAMAVLHEPKVLVLDEPFMGVDPSGARWIRQELRRLADQGSAILTSSHTLMLVEKLADRIVIMNRGKIIAEGTVDELRQSLDGTEKQDLEDLFLKITQEEKK